MALSPQFLDDVRARTPLSALIGRKTRLAKSGRHWKGCCPFHGEKTPSFYVYDDHFHCFGCGVHGDAISFVMQSGGASFIDAVEQLAGEAGLDMPAPIPGEAAAAQRRHDLGSVLQAAQEFYRARLAEPAGQAGLAYLRERGLQDATIARFGLGWSGDGRGGLIAALTRQDIEPAQLAEAGLLRQSDEGGPPRELFFNRVTFPIRDRRGRIISFGGRILGAGQPKYLNGPETPLYSKRRTLYGLDQAREGVRGGADPVVVEGYMDVIGLHQAGFTGAVAPLGTALTAEQLEELWRLGPAPVLCFDGDAAGSRAALRAMEVALPMLQPDRSLRVAVLPTGEDPDSLVRDGPARFAGILHAARPLEEALFEAVRAAMPAGTPETRAALRQRLIELSEQIGHKGLAGEYRRAFLDRFFAARSRKRGGAPIVVPSPRSRPDGQASHRQRLFLLAAILLRHPDLIGDVEDAWCRLDMPPELDRLRGAMLDGWCDHAHSPDAHPMPIPSTAKLDSAGLIAHLRSLGLSAEVESVLQAVSIGLPACGRSDAMPAEAEAGWWHFYGLLHPDRLEREIEEARRAFPERPEQAQHRLIVLCAARDALRRGEQGLEVDG